MPEQHITVGRVVHYYDGDEARPLIGPFTALTTGVYADTPTDADLAIFRPGTTGSAALSVPFSDEPQAGCWTWQPVQRNQRPDVGAPR